MLFFLSCNLLYYHRLHREQLEMTKTSERFSTDFVMGGAAAIMAKSAAAPIERVKLLLQNQGEMIKRGQLRRPYMGVGDCFRRVLREDGLLSFWRGNQANVIRYFPTQVLWFSLLYEPAVWSFFLKSGFSRLASWVLIWKYVPHFSMEMLMRIS